MYMNMSIWIYVYEYMYMQVLEHEINIYVESFTAQKGYMYRELYMYREF